MFSSTFTTFFLALVAATLVRSAPIPPLDAATLLKNGQEAQKLNTLFQTIKETDPCTSGEKACMSGGVAVCAQGKWKTSNGECSKTQKCFVLPSVQEAGTLVTCTSEKSALSAIDASGATGGILGATGGNSTSAGDDNNENNGNATSATATSSSTADKSISTSSPDNNDSGDDEDEYDGECEDEGENTSATTTPTAPTSPSASEKSPASTPTPSSASGNSAESTSTPSPDADTDPVTVTVTLTAQPTTFAPQTRTLSPGDASSVLSSLMANGATIIVSPSASGSADVKEPLITTAPAAQPSGTTLNQAAPTTVPLTAAPSASVVSSGGYDYDY